MAAKKSPAKATSKAAKPKSARRAAPASSKAKSGAAAGGLPDRIFAQASPRSVGGLPLFSAGEISAANVINFASEDYLIRDAVTRLQGVGFEVLQVSRTTINIAGPASLYEQVFGTTLAAQERETRKSGGVVEEATFIESLDTEMPGFIQTSNSPLADVLEGVAIERPIYWMAPDAFPPSKSYWHLDVPGDVSLGINADRAHRSGITGRGIKVMSTDSGWEPHPYFVQRGYRFSATVAGPGAVNPAVDENGHGTAESANIFAVAPDVDYTMVKINFANSTGAFNAAVAMNPHIITNSWGSDNRLGPLGAADLALAAAIASAVANGIIVVFSAGNGHWGFPGQHPDVISAGGVFMDRNGALRASNYASGFVSNIYPGRQSPDVCGLVGMLPRAAYIMLPLPAGCQIDTQLAGGAHPNADETLANDGWAAISGTSAAAPQLAGVAALIKQACPRLTPAEVRAIMKATARDVTVGASNPNTPGVAGVGPDTATGAGLVDAHKAVLSAKLRCLPIGPIRPIVVQPVHPIQPILPVQPIQPVQPISPISPVIPIQPVAPIQPVIPIQPIAPIQPVIPVGPVGPIGPIGPVGPVGPANEFADQAQAQSDGVGLTSEDIAYLEQVIIENGDDLGL